MPDRTPVGARLELEVDDLGGSLHAAQERLASFVACSGVGARPAYRANLVFEELVTNALKYGGPAGAPARVRCSVDVEPEQLVLAFRDRGRRFDPSAAPPPPRATTLDEATVGGLGLELVRKVSTALDYRREDGENLIRVHLALDPD